MLWGVRGADAGATVVISMNPHILQVTSEWRQATDLE